MTAEAPDRTEYLGRFEELEAEIVLEILREAGIYAFTKEPLTESEQGPYPGILSDRGVILVDAARHAEAERVVAEQLPQHLAAIEEAMAALDSGEGPGEPDA